MQKVEAYVPRMLSPNYNITVLHCLEDELVLKPFGSLKLGCVIRDKCNSSERDETG